MRFHLIHRKRSPFSCIGEGLVEVSRSDGLDRRERIPLPYEPPNMRSVGDGFPVPREDDILPCRNVAEYASENSKSPPHQSAIRLTASPYPGEALVEVSQGDGVG